MKPLVTTRSRTVKSVQTKIRKAVKAFLAREVKKHTVELFFQGLIFYKFQRSMYEQMRKIYPIASCEIRWVAVIERSKTYEKVVPVKEEVKKPEAVKEEPKPAEKEAVKEEPKPVEKEEVKEEPKPEVTEPAEKEPVKESEPEVVEPVSEEKPVAAE